MKVGLQLYSVRDVTEADLHGALKEVAALGYENVEFAGFFGHSGEEVAQWLKELGLRASGTHTGLDALEKDFDQIVACHRAIGCELVIVPWADAKTAAEADALLTRMTAMQGLDPREIRRQAREISWYGSVTPQELQACAAPVTEMLGEGPQALADAVCTDHRLRQRFLQLMALPLDWPGTLLAGAAMAMPPQERACLMREVLLQHPSPSAAKRVAVAVLADMNVPPPYAAWQDGRIAWIDPTRPPAETPAFRERLLTLRIRRAQRLCPDDPSIALWGMQQIHRMTPSQRRDVIADPSRVWPLALAIQYRALHGLNPLHIDLHRMGGMRAAALDQALRTLQALPTT